MNRPDDGGSMHLWNVVLHQQGYTALYPRWLSSLYSPPWDPFSSKNESRLIMFMLARPVRTLVKCLIQKALCLFAFEVRVPYRAHSLRELRVHCNRLSATCDGISRGARTAVAAFSRILWLVMEQLKRNRILVLDSRCMTGREFNISNLRIAIRQIRPTGVNPRWCFAQHIASASPCNRAKLKPKLNN
jgi:hypothetical protein